MRQRAMRMRGLKSLAVADLTLATQHMLAMTLPAQTVRRSSERKAF